LTGTIAMPDLVTMHGAVGRCMLPSYHQNAQQILCKGQERNGWEEKQGERKGKEMQRSVSTHTVMVICRKGKVRPSANVLPSNLRKRHFSSKGETLELKEGGIPACLHMHSSVEEKSSTKW